MKTIFALLMLFCSVGFTQTVETLASVKSDGDVEGGPGGSVFLADGQSTIYRIDEQRVVSKFVGSAEGIVRPLGLAFNHTAAILYVANTPLNQSGWISAVDMQGQVTTLTSGLTLPTELAVGPQGNLFVTTQDQRVWKVTPDGAKEVYVSSTTFNRPHGIAVDDDGTLYVASAHDGNIYRVDSSREISWFAKVNGLNEPWACGFMTTANGALYITNGDNIIHRIDLQSAAVTDYAGSGLAGGQDGAALEAEFNAPNGMGRSADGSELYVSEWGTSRVRVIHSETHASLQLTLPWIVNNSQWSTELGLFNGSDAPQTYQLRAVDRVGTTRERDIQVAPFSLYSATSSDLFDDLSGYALYVASESPQVYGSYLTFNLELASGGKSPSETVGCPVQTLTDTLLYGYLQTAEIPALVMVAPFLGDQDTLKVHMEMYSGRGSEQTTTLTLNGTRPIAALLSDLFEIDSNMGAVSVIARAEGSGLICGTAFVFNQMRQPSMAPAIQLE